MARKAKYTEALPVYVTPKTRGRILGISKEYEVSQADVVRLLVDLGLQIATTNTFVAAFPRED